MENTTIKINCWELKNGKEIPLLPTSTLDGFEWNGKYRLIVSNDDGSLGLPFLFATDDTAILTVETSEQDGMDTGDKKIKQVISCVPRSLGNEITCSRIRSYNGKEHVWSAWETISSASGTKVTWDASSCVDTFITAGIYNISGERLNVKDGLPIANSNPGHTINARLVVLDSSISGTGDTDDKCITQILTLSNRSGGDGDVYIRTGRAQSTNMLAGGSGWEPWGKLQQNIEVGQVTSLNSFIGNGIYSGVYTNGSSFFETFVMVVINNYAVAGATGQVRSVSQFKYALNVDSTFSYKTRTGRGNTGISWGEWVDLGAATTTDIQDGAVTAQKLSNDVREKVEIVPSLEENVAKEKTALLNGDTVVGLAREVYSRQGKVDTATFLKRTTAGGTSISDGVATLRQIGGNTVKNLVDGTFCSSWRNMSNSAIAMNGCVAEVSSLSPYGGITVDVEFVVSHTYYCKVLANPLKTSVYIRMFGVETPPVNGGWQLLSLRSSKSGGDNKLSIRGNTEGNYYLLYPLLLDLTVMFGAGNEPTKEECDKIFGTMDVLPQGLTIAQPTGLKSTGYNQWNPNDVLADKTVTDNALATLEGSNIAVVECLPCKTGAGENNGYVIGYGEGDAWSEEGIEVYLSPFNPLEVEGKLYLQKLAKNATTATYLPQIKGFLLVVTPITDRLCVNFLWSEDRARTDYEEYIESNVTLPAIPEMSEYGLAGIQSSGSLACDVIDLESYRYIKRIKRTELWLMSWRIENITLSSTGESYRTFVSSSLKDMKFRGYNIMQNAIIGNYTNKITLALGEEELLDKQFMVSSTGNLFIRNDSYESLDVFKNSLDGQYVYYEIDEPLEYPILVKSAPNYIANDYGFEEFTGSKVPLMTNILFYMRSLVSETRNFLDRLMARLGVSDATAAADRLLKLAEQSVGD